MIGPSAFFPSQPNFQVSSPMAPSGFPELGQFTGIGSPNLGAVAPQGFQLGAQAAGMFPAQSTDPRFPQPGTLGAQPQLFSSAPVDPLGMQAMQQQMSMQAAMQQQQGLMAGSPPLLANFGGPVGAVPSVPGAAGMMGGISAGMFGPPVGSQQLSMMTGGASPMMGMPGMMDMSGMMAAQVAQQQQQLAAQQAAMQQQQLAAQQAAQAQQMAPLSNAAPPPAAAPMTPPAQGDQSMQLLQMMMQMMMMMLQMMVRILQPQQQTPAFDIDATSAFLKNAQQASGVSAPRIAGPTNVSNTTSNGSQKAQLDQSLAKIASDPEGAALLAAAKAKGITIEVGNPATAGGQFDMEPVNCNCGQHGGTDAQFDGSTVVNGVTLTRGNQTKIVVRDPSNVKTIVHELVHAVSTGDGNSKEEEGIADVIGSRVAHRVGGAGALSGSDQQIYTNKQRFYGNLKQSNGIRSTLAQLGIGVSV